MKISVLAYVPSQAPLVESALAAQDASTPGLSSDVQLPEGLTPDTSFPPVPIGTGAAGVQTMESLSPRGSANFAIRATLDVESRDSVPAAVGGTPVFADPEIAPFVTCGGGAVGTHRDVEAHLDLAALRDAGLDGDGVAIAILDNGINLPHLISQLGRAPRIDPANSWTPPGVSTNPYQFAPDHGTMCAYDALLAAPNATLLDFPILKGQAPAGTISGQVLSSALQAFSQLLVFWAVAFAPGGGLRYKALVVNNSWGLYHPTWDFPPGHPGRYVDNPSHPFNVVVSTLANANADILFAAGNCGADCPDGQCQGKVSGTIMGANALDSVLTLAGCDTNDQRVGYSSQGPAIAGMPPEKPDLTAYTHFLGSEAFGQNLPDTGTSTACPVAAGVVAALRTASGANPMSVPPQSLFATLRATARQVQGPAGWNADYGHGIINPTIAGQALGILPAGAAGS